MQLSFPHQFKISCKYSSQADVTLRLLLQEKSSSVKLSFAIPDQLHFNFQEKVVKDDNDLIMALGRQALKERRAAQGLPQGMSDRRKVRASPFQQVQQERRTSRGNKSSSSNIL